MRARWLPVTVHTVSLTFTRMRSTVVYAILAGMVKCQDTRLQTTVPQYMFELESDPEHEKKLQKKLLLIDRDRGKKKENLTIQN